MQEPATGSASCAGTAIYADCDVADTAHLNAMSMELITAIAKLLGEEPVALDCANPATYDQLCRAILKAVQDGILAALTKDDDGNVTAIAGCPIASGDGGTDPGGGGGDTCDADADGVVRPIGTVLTITGGQATVNVGDDVSTQINAFFNVSGTWEAQNSCDGSNSGTEGDCPIVGKKTAC